MTDLTRCKEFLRDPTYLPPDELRDWADDIQCLEDLITEARALIGAKEGELLAKIINLKWRSERNEKLENLRTVVEDILPHIGAYDEPNSRHSKVQALLTALYDTDPKPEDKP